MHILACILMFVVFSVIAACNGDFSGIVAILKVVGFLIFFIFMLWIFTQPVLFIIVLIIVLFIIFIVNSSSKK